MIKSRVIRNYEVQDELPINASTSLPKIVKQSVATDEIKVGIPGETIPRKGEPVIKVNKNQQGIVTSIDVICSCGETLSIELDY